MTKSIKEKERVVVRFAGDSGDGMQLAGSRFTDATALIGNDLATLPDFPAEIRAPAGFFEGGRLTALASSSSVFFHASPPPPANRLGRPIHESFCEKRTRPRHAPCVSRGTAHRL